MLDALKELGLERNTLVIHHSDNGGGGLGGKLSGLTHDDDAGSDINTPYVVF